MNRRRKQRSQLDAMDQINITPLLDLTFLLLIVFMITMPLMEYGTNITPPEMNSEKLPDDNFKSVTILKDGSIEIDKQIVGVDDMIQRLTRAKEENPKVAVLLRADGSRSYKEVIELMAAIRRAGFEDVTLVTQAEEK